MKKQLVVAVSQFFLSVTRMVVIYEIILQLCRPLENIRINDDLQIDFGFLQEALEIRGCFRGWQLHAEQEKLFTGITLTYIDSITSPSQICTPSAFRAG